MAIENTVIIPIEAAVTVTPDQIQLSIIGLDHLVQQDTVHGNILTITATTSELAWPRGALRIVLTVDGRLGNLVLTCLDPVWIRGPRGWSDTDLTVAPALAADGFQVADRPAGVELVAGWITVAENMKLKPPAPARPAPQPQPKGTEPVVRTGQPVRVVLNEYNRTARRGTVEHSFWHSKHHCWYFLIRDDRGRRVSKQYATEDLQPDEPA